MSQSTSLHVAVIMDGNGRWAARRGLPRAAGHRAGADAVRRVVEVAPDQGVTALTLFAFSADNWKRPPTEVAALMRLFARHLHTETPRLVENGVRLEVVGRRDRLPAPRASGGSAGCRKRRPDERAHRANETRPGGLGYGRRPGDRGRRAAARDTVGAERVPLYCGACGGGRVAGVSAPDRRRARRALARDGRRAAGLELCGPRL